MLQSGISIARHTVHSSFLQAVINVQRQTHRFLAFTSLFARAYQSEFLLPIGKDHFTVLLLESRASIFMPSPWVALHN